MSDALLENPNLNSSHLFRADIIFDSTGILKTNREKEDFCSFLCPTSSQDLPHETGGSRTGDANEARSPLRFAGFEVRRTVLRKLIPRNLRLDRPLLQTCHIYTTHEENMAEPDEILSREKYGECQPAHISLNERLKNKMLYKLSIARDKQHLVVYQPHTHPLTGSDMPWYHPPLSFLAFLYSHDLQLHSPPGSEGEKQPCGALSIHFQFFRESSLVNDPSSIPDRLHRTLLSLLSTFTRLARNTSVCVDPNDGEEKAVSISAVRHIKDNIIPEHLVQNTYSRLKNLYAPDLIKRWVEKTDPSKHVFEDLSIAAFLLELWRKMYGSNSSKFPGFVDIACGNGVLVYILLMEGFQGWGFDARCRRTWSIFPEVVTTHLKETVCIPRPFIEALRSQGCPVQEDLSVHDGIFETGTFIISNHADELTTWTPLLAALSNPESPLPWLAIPCCSHALSGAAHRYQSSPSRSTGASTRPHVETLHNGDTVALDRNEQPRAGDLIALRAFKDQSPVCLEQGQSKGTNSTYASLVDQVTHLAKKLYVEEDVQQTLMRIPSTRNIGVVVGQLQGLQSRGTGQGRLIRDLSPPNEVERLKPLDLARRIYDIVEEECVRSGGVAEAAKIWMVSVQRARGTPNHASGSG